MDDDIRFLYEDKFGRTLLRTLVCGALLAVTIIGGTCVAISRSNDNAAVQRVQFESQKAHDEALKAMWEKQKAP